MKPKLFVRHLLDGAYKTYFGYEGQPGAIFLIKFVPCPPSRHYINSPYKFTFCPEHGEFKTILGKYSVKSYAEAIEWVKAVLSRKLKTVKASVAWENMLKISEEDSDAR